MMKSLRMGLFSRFSNAFSYEPCASDNQRERVLLDKTEMRLYLK